MLWGVSIFQKTSKPNQKPYANLPNKRSPEDQLHTYAIVWTHPMLHRTEDSNRRRLLSFKIQQGHIDPRNSVEAKSKQSMFDEMSILFDKKRVFFNRIGSNI